ncbi:DUF4097 family beta strand repeat-containing protein, partial [Streptococcus pneumoniae]|uniref:DUF4097 family beta strand repeat-containing protein n=1 Tax=Streptococcus pneumoniae TaxID=1313 RepID=UPI000B1DAAD0
FGKEVENLEITLHQHTLTITDSFDDQIHISYHPSLSAHHDLITNQNDRTLSLTDKKLSETPFLSSGIGGILHNSQLESTENHFHAENIQVHGKVELTAKDYLRI